MVASKGNWVWVLRPQVRAPIPPSPLAPTPPLPKFQPRPRVTTHSLLFTCLKVAMPSYLIPQRKKKRPNSKVRSGGSSSISTCSALSINHQLVSLLAKRLNDIRGRHKVYPSDSLFTLSHSRIQEAVFYSTPSSLSSSPHSLNCPFPHSLPPTPTNTLIRCRDALIHRHCSHRLQ